MLTCVRCIDDVITFIAFLRYRGFEAVLVSVQQERFSCTLKLVQGPMAGETVSGVDLEDVSKL